MSRNKSRFRAHVGSRVADFVRDPYGKLMVLPGIRHMVQHVAADRVIAEIDELAMQARAATH